MYFVNMQQYHAFLYTIFICFYFALYDSYSSKEQLPLCLQYMHISINEVLSLNNWMKELI